MSEERGFLSRWSRRKQAASHPAEPAAPAVPTAEAGVTAVPLEQALPDIETLGAGSDYAAFLQKGVGAALQQQALARAWTTDAGIAGFRGMADYDWDFNATGYGRLWAVDDVASLLRTVLSPGTEVGAPIGEVSSSAPEDVVAEAEPIAVRISELPPENAAELHWAAADMPTVSEQDEPRRHGSALPS